MQTRRYRLPEDALVRELRRCADELGAPPTMSTFDRWARQQHPHVPGAATLSKRLGRWPAALRAAGLDPAGRRLAAEVPGSAPDTAERRAAAAALQRFARAVGAADLDVSEEWEASQLVSRAAYARWQEEREPQAPTLNTLRRIFGLWASALHEAGLASSATRPTRTLEFTDADIDGALRQAAADLDIGPRLGFESYQRWRDQTAGRGVPTGRLIWERHGSWAAALANAGVRIPRPATLDALRAWLAATDAVDAGPEAYMRWAAARDPDAPAVRDLMAKHGGWAAALRAAGAVDPPVRTGAPAWENVDMIDALKAWAKDPDTGTLHTSDRYRAWEQAHELQLPTDAAIAVRFGGWITALTAAGLESGEEWRHRFRPLAPDAVERALEAFAAAEPDPSRRSAYRYNAWRAANAPWAPSKGTLQARFSGWAEVRKHLALADASK